MVFSKKLNLKRETLRCLRDDQAKWIHGGDDYPPSALCGESQDTCDSIKACPVPSTTPDSFTHRTTTARTTIG